TALATGESVGQVSSQTLPNLRTIDAAADVPVLRPLLGHDKSEIVALAEGWGTFDISKGPEVCDVLGPDRPMTRSDPAQATAEEVKLPAELIERLLDGLRSVAL
ncbi:MAG TPA: tRNA 4-thiouridine(8) synthase ThiI, partial [Candidatus Thermoplasmatota archaeon]|nr:tRNA 4-thiouridine(8) synthase ThiI [Candidatus Thermoplasmatota archaeon]